MALFTTGSITSATPSTALMTVIDTNMLAVGWVFIETYTNGANVTNVYKSPGSLNSWGIDFYVGINRASTTGNVIFMIGELYDVGTHKFRKYAVGGGSNSIPDTDGTIVDASGRLPTAMSSGANVFVLLYTSQKSNYYLSCSIDRVILGTDYTNFSTAGTSPMYVGLYDPLYSFDKFPLCVIQFGTGNNSPGNFYGCVTREFATIALANNFCIQLPSSAGTFQYPTVAYGSSTEYYTQNNVATRMALASTHSPGTAVRGLLKDLVYFPGGYNIGDTLQITVNAVTYTYIRVHQTAYASGNYLTTIWCPTF